MSDKRLWILASAGAIIGILAVGGIAMNHFGGRTGHQTIESVALAASSPAANPKPSTITYDGHDGQTALAILKSRAVVTMQGVGDSAYVTSINGHRANDLKREYWALYVNGAPCDEGADEYISHDGDHIEWKLATY